VSLGASVNYAEVMGLASAPLSSNVFTGNSTAALTDSVRGQIATSLCGSKFTLLFPLYEKNIIINVLRKL